MLVRARFAYFVRGSNLYLRGVPPEVDPFAEVNRFHIQHFKIIIGYD